MLYNEAMRYILIQYLTWQFFDSPREILKAIKNFLLFYLDYFSIPLLLKTFFWHWHKYSYSYGKSFNPGRYFEAFAFNMMSRVVGAILRAFFIIAGVAAELVILFFGALIFFIWILLPFAATFFLVFGFNLIFFK